MTQRFTGWHMLAIMIAGFGLVIAVNVVMARAAISTFGGEVVENSYVASQRYNGWLKAAAAQNSLGWHVAASADPTGILHVAVTDAAGAPLLGEVTVIARHPLGRMPDRRITLHANRSEHAADRSLPAGRWLLHIDVRAQGHDARFETEVDA